MAEVSPREIAHGTPFTWEIRKPHAGIIQFVIVFPNGDHYVWRQVGFHSDVKVAENKTEGVAAPPADWLVETARQRAARAEAEEKKREKGPR